MTQPHVLAGADAFSFPGGPTGALLIHGLTGSPQGLLALGEYLAARGVAVEAVRLPGHGTTWQDLETTTAQDWRTEVATGYARLAERCDEIFVVAMSFGAALAVEFVGENPEAAAGLVTLGGWVHTDDPRRFFAPIVRRVIRSIPGVGNDICDPEGHEICYERVPTRAAEQSLKVLKAARRRLTDVRCPVLVMHGSSDHTVKPTNARLIYESVASEDKQLVWCERSYHVITLDYDKNDVQRRTYEFIKERSRHGI